MSLSSNGSLSLSEINRTVRFTNGNLSIGATDSDGKLYMYDASTIRIKMQVPNATTQISAHSDTKSYFQSSGDILFTGINTSSLRHLYLATSGNVGIRTDTSPPLAKLQVALSTILATNGGDVIGANLFWNGTSWTRGNSNFAGFGLRIGNSGDAYGHGMQILTMDTANGFGNRMLIGANGNVGIGTTNPNQKLEVTNRIQVTQTGAVSAVMEMGNASGTAYLFNNPSGSVYLIPSNTSSNLILNADELGNTWGSIAVGTSNPNSSAQLHVNSSIFIPTQGSLWLTGQGNNAPNRLRLYQDGATGNGGSYIDFMGGPLFFRSGVTSLSTLLTVTTSGNVGIGTTSPNQKLTVKGLTLMYDTLRVGDSSSSRSFLINFGTTGVGGNRTGYIYGDGTNMFIVNQQNGIFSLATNNGGNEIRLVENGRLGIGNANPQGRLHVEGSPAISMTTDDIYIIGLDFDSSNKTGGKFWRTKSTHQSASEGQGKFIIQNETDGITGFHAGPNGAVSIGTMTPANNGLQIKSSYGDVGEFQLGPTNSNAFHMYGVSGALEHYSGTWGVGTYRGKWYNNGLEIWGALSKGSGSFDIQHPLHPDDSNKRLVHSFVEGPRCDLIYRGQVILVNGIASVNLDTDCVEEQDCGMSPGTFEALCANPQILLQNVTSFSKIRGRINGNILTIESQDTTSTDIISWSVIAERKDPYIKSWERTNTNGYLKTEYIKSN